MGQLAPFIGAGISTALGFGPQAGWIIGSLVGTILFPASGPTVEGPRLGDLTVMSSAYGAGIPITFGTMRMAPNMIWSTGIEEVKNSEKVGGKGGAAAQTNVTYEYFATFAIAFGEGVADDLLRMWADGKLIYDKTGTDDDITKVDLNFRFYPGTETQDPDSLIEADRGVDATPAFRGMCYVVVDRLALKDFGNRIPSITAEITFAAAINVPTNTIDFFTVAEGGLTNGWDRETLCVDHDRGLHYFGNDIPSVLRRANTRTMVEDRQKSWGGVLDAKGNRVAFTRIVCVLSNGSIMMRSDNGNTAPISIIDPDSLQITDTFGVKNNGLNMDPFGFESISPGKCSSIEVGGALGPEHYFLAGSVFGSVGILNGTGGGLDYVWDSDTAPGQPTPGLSGLISTCRGAAGSGFGHGYVLGDTGGDAVLWRLTVNGGAFYDSVQDSYQGVVFDHIGTFTPGTLIPGETGINNVRGPIYDATDDTVLFFAKADSNSQAHLFKVDPRLGTILWRTAVPSSPGSDLDGIIFSLVENGVYAYIAGGTAWAVDTISGEQFYQQGGWSPTARTTDASLWWNGRTNTIISADNISAQTKYILFRGAGEGAGVDTIVSALTARGGLLSSDIDVTDLAGQSVPGYTIARQSTIRGAIQPLASVFYFDGVESDDVLKFVLRDGKTTAVTIPQDDLALLGGDSGEFFRENRVQEVELPTRFTITYMDRDNDYLQIAHNAQRILGPTSTMSSRNEMGLEIAAALETDFAKQAAEKGLYSSWIERSSYELRLPWTYLALDPSDIVDISLDDGTLFHTRFVSTDVGMGFTMEISALSEDAAQYTSTVLSDGGDSGLVQEFLSTAITKTLLLCAPLLRDSDDTGRAVSNLYFFMGGFGQPGWTAATLFKSPEGTEYAQVGSVVDEMTWGTSSTILGDVVDPNITDEVNSVTLFMNTNADRVVSTTQLEMVNGANAAALIHANGIDVEIFQFRDVVVNVDTSITLSGLLRGRRGSEVFTANHAVGNIFVLLEVAAGSITLLSLGERDATRFYRGVTSGGLFEEATVLTKASPLVDLKPYAPVLQTAAPSGNNIILNWVRRTRVGGELQGGTGTVPLSEDSEEYELEILDTPGGSVVRTVVSLSSPTYTYLEADQNTDGFTPPLSQITIRVYQISAQVGRGFTEEVTLDVE